jgi:hypothetical protein
MSSFLLIVNCQFNDTIASLLTTSAAESVVHPAWDKHIKDLEHLLEIDLERVELDAAAASVTLISGSNNGTLAQDLLRVRQDIDRLVSSVKEVEGELGRTKDKIAEDERDIQQKNAAMETEKFLDGLHRGKVNMKVDYVTGQLVARPKSPSSLKKKGNRRKRRMQSAAVGKGNATALLQDDGLNGTSASAVSRLATGTANVPPAESRRQQPQPTKPQLGKKKAQSNEGYDEVVNAAANGDNNMDDDEFMEQKKKASETVRQHIESHPDIQSRIKEEMEFLRSGSDPAVLNFDGNLMLDIVKLAMTASLFGLAAVFMKLPPTAGFLVGGMLIGPSCLDIVGEIHQVQTLAQFGAIFLLFEQGLLYSQTYSGEQPRISSPAANEEQDDADNTQDVDEMMVLPTSLPRMELSVYSRKGVATGSNNQTMTSTPPESLSLSTAPSFIFEDDHDPNVVGSIILILLVFVALSVVVLTNVATSVPEAIMVSCTIALCSTTIVSETLQAAHLADTQWGIGVLKMIVSAV